MRRLPTRQVHLDFHTSPLIPGVGSRFDKKQFQTALKEGNVNSITIFAKCHHGMCYYPTKVGTVHPTLEPGFDLTGAMMDAAHEVGADAPVYITTGFSALDAANHPEWCMRDKAGNIMRGGIDPDAEPDDPRPYCSWDYLCMSGDYAKHIYDTTREICDRYERLDGLFFDIVYLGDTCYCPNCLAGMKAEGLDPDDIEDAREYYRRLHLRFMDECTKILHEKHPDATIFFNSGGAEIYRPEYHDGQTHYEMEDLPTAWGGYDKMPPRASFMSRYGKDYLGMTGKFHTEWGEFGGYKNPDALKYEALLMAMYGARVSIGDQMPPDGEMDPATYKVIGHAYRALEEAEPWCYPAESTAKVGVYLCGNGASDEGLHKMLLEAHIDFEVVMPGDDLGRFDTLILPDSVALSKDEAARVKVFTDNGGAVLFNYQSAVADDSFLLDAGTEKPQAPAFRQDYLLPGEKMPLAFGNAPFICYEAAMRSTVTDGEVLSNVVEPWFDRTYEHYCSHRNTPYRREAASYPAVVRKGKTVYLAHPLFRLYYREGAQLYRDVFLKALELVNTPVYTVEGLMSMGRTRLVKQPGRYVFHAAYASPVQRGHVSVLEDMPLITGAKAHIRVNETVTAVRLAPSLEEIAFEQKDGVVSFGIPDFRCHCIIEIDIG